MSIVNLLLKRSGDILLYSKRLQVPASAQLGLGCMLTGNTAENDTVPKGVTAQTARTFVIFHQSLDFVPFIILQLVGLFLIILWPELVTWLPIYNYSSKDDPFQQIFLIIILGPILFFPRADCSEPALRTASNSFLCLWKAIKNQMSTEY
jgi:hypothetical protein